LTFAGTAQAHTFEAGALALKIDANENDDCTGGLDEELCLFGWDKGRSLGMEDDTIAFNKSIEKVTFEFKDPPPGGQPVVFSFQPDQLQFENPVFTAAKSAWVNANEDIPDAIGSHAQLVSPERSAMSPGDSSERTSGLAVQTDAQVDAPGDYDETPGRVWVVCWDLTCGHVYWTQVRTNETHVQLLKDEGSIGNSAYDTDRVLGSLGTDGESPLTCLNPPLDAACPPETDLRTQHAGPAGEAAKDVTPRATLFVKYNKTTVRVFPVPLAADAQRTSNTTSLGFTDAQPTATLAPPERASPANNHPKIPDPKPFTNPARVEPDSRREPQAQATVLQESVVPTLTTFKMLGNAIAIFLSLLYTTLKRERILDQHTRKLVYDALCRNPGVRVGTLASSLGLNYKTVFHHLAALEAFNFVKRCGHGDKLYFPVGEMSLTEEAMCAGALSRSAARETYKFIVQHGPMDLTSLARSMGRAPSTISANVSTLRAGGLVKRVRMGGKWVVSACPEPAPLKTASRFERKAAYAALNRWQHADPVPTP
jgi:predicted transcriptional regulator